MNKYISLLIGWMALLELFKEPMLILLIAVAIIILFWGQNSEAYILCCNHCSRIRNLQDNRSRKALEALENLTNH
jgi:Ca2+-transporting ATPase